jgi:hypothetical protein
MNKREQYHISTQTASRAHPAHQKVDHDAELSFFWPLGWEGFAGSAALMTFEEM